MQKKNHYSIRTTFHPLCRNKDSPARVRPRFFDQVGHDAMYASSRNKHFSLNLVIVRPTKIMNRADKERLLVKDYS